MSEQICIVWLNTDRINHPQARLLQTFSTPTTPPTPLCFPVEELEALEFASNVLFVHSEDDFARFLPGSSPKMPLAVPIDIAGDILGWEFFQHSHFTV